MSVTTDLENILIEKGMKKEEIYEGFEDFKIGATLQALRESAGLTQSELADRMEISKSVISRMEHNADVKYSTIRKVAKALGQDLEMVFHPNKTDSHE